MNPENVPADWAVEFDNLAKEKILDGNFAPLVGYKGLGTIATLSIPTNEHYLPLLYTLALKDKQDTVEFFNESIDLGSVSMRSLYIG
jgi:4,5-DOPA dioxygenase extradiol